MVAVRTQELIDQIAVCRMNFDAVETSHFNGILGSLGIGRNDFRKLALFKRTRFGGWRKFAGAIRMHKIGL